MSMKCHLVWGRLHLHPGLNVAAGAPTRHNLLGPLSCKSTPVLIYRVQPGTHMCLPFILIMGHLDKRAWSLGTLQVLVAKQGINNAETTPRYGPWTLESEVTFGWHWATAASRGRPYANRYWPSSEASASLDRLFKPIAPRGQAGLTAHAEAGGDQVSTCWSGYKLHTVAKCHEK